MVTADCLRRGFPTADGMAAFTIRAERSPVKIRVAAGTFYRCFSKNFRNVARITGDRFVHAAERKTGLRRMAELRLRTQRRPAGLRMTVLARDGNGPMRIADRLRICGLRRTRGYRQQHRRSHPNTQAQAPHCSTFRPHHLSDSGELRWYLFGLNCAQAARIKNKWCVNSGVHLNCNAVDTALRVRSTLQSHCHWRGTPCIQAERQCTAESLVYRQ